MKKKLLLINPVNPNRTGLTISRTSRYPPLGLGIVAALTPNDWDVQIYDENFDKFQYMDADLVGLSAFTTQINRAYEIARIYHEKGIPTVIGGIHASMVPEEAAKYVDVVVIGEAEGSWPRVIEDFVNGKLKRIYTNNSGQFKISAARHDLFHSNYIFGSIQTARGCPMNCNFCSVTAFNGHKYRQRNINEVLDELATIPQDYIYFVDDNIYGYGKDAASRAIELFEGIVQRNIRKEWISQASINFADSPAVLASASKAGCKMILLGIEAETSSALEDAEKKLNQKRLDSYKEVFQRINDQGIAVLGSFIYGMESDTPQSLSKRTQFILKNKIDAAQVSVLTPLPGTRLFSRLKKEGRLLYTDFPKDWLRYDMTEVVFQPLLMSQQELTKALSDAAIMLYNHSILCMKGIRTWINTKDYTAAVWAYIGNLNYQAAAVGHLLQRIV